MQHSITHCRQSESSSNERHQMAHQLTDELIYAGHAPHVRRAVLLPPWVLSVNLAGPHRHIPRCLPVHVGLQSSAATRPLAHRSVSMSAQPGRNGPSVAPVPAHTHEQASQQGDQLRDMHTMDEQSVDVGTPACLLHDLANGRPTHVLPRCSQGQAPQLRVAHDQSQ